MTINGKDYGDLVINRRGCKICDTSGKRLKNLQEVNPEFDRGLFIGPWSRWQGSLTPKIMLVGQDWGDDYYYETNGGLEALSNATNNNIIDLFNNPLGIHLNTPHECAEDLEKQNPDVFFTNVILCLKCEVISDQAETNPKKQGRAGLQGNISQKWADNCSREFLKPLIGLLRPRVIIALGKGPYLSILRAYGSPEARRMANTHLDEIVDCHHLTVMNETRVYPVFHCGNRGVNQFRKCRPGCSDKLERHREDWMKIREYLDMLNKNGNW